MATQEDNLHSYLTGFPFLVALWTLPAVWDLIINNAFRFTHLQEKVWSFEVWEKELTSAMFSHTIRHTDLQTAGVNDLITDGALHQRQTELLLLRLHRVLLPRFTAGKTHGCVRQHRLEDDITTDTCYWCRGKNFDGFASRLLLCTRVRCTAIFTAVHCLSRHDCFIRPGPPNFFMSLQKWHSPHSVRMQAWQRRQRVRRRRAPPSALLPDIPSAFNWQTYTRTLAVLRHTYNSYQFTSYQTFIKHQRSVVTRQSQTYALCEQQKTSLTFSKVTENYVWHIIRSSAVNIYIRMGDPRQMSNVGFHSTDESDVNVRWCKYPCVFSITVIF